MAASQSLRDELVAHGLENVYLWSRGVDLGHFEPSTADCFDLPRPIFLYVGRVAVEKNIEAFLKLELPGTKVVIGSGPQLDELKRRYPAVCFTGPKFGKDLADHYASADVFVFPSLTDTFGNVILEALASGVPVAAFPSPGLRMSSRMAVSVFWILTCKKPRLQHFPSTGVLAVSTPNASVGPPVHAAFGRLWKSPMIPQLLLRRCPLNRNLAPSDGLFHVQPNDK